MTETAVRQKVGQAAAAVEDGGQAAATRLEQMGHGLVRHPVVRGHPVHAMASDLPVTLIPAAFTASLVAGARRRPRASEQTASWITRIAAAAAAAAAAGGWWDWLTMPADHPARRTATWHGLVNSAGAGVVAAAVFSDGHRRSALLGLATGSLLVGAWLGGEIVFHHGWRVRPAEEAEIVAGELRRRGIDDVLAGARREVDDFERRETYFAR